MVKRIFKNIMIVLFLIIVFLATMISSFALTIEPEESLSNVYVNEPHIATITLTNNQAFTIYNITFSNIEYFNFPKIDKLEPSESIEYNFTILADASFDRTPFTSIISFQYMEDIPTEPQTHYISITEQGFEPDDITIYQADSIRFSNNDTITRLITSSEWNYDIPSGSIQLETFNTIKDITYYCTYLYNTGQIHVRNRTLNELAHNSEYDKQMIINLESKYHATNLTLEMLNEKNFTINWNSMDESLLKITNNGDEPAYNIKLSSNNGNVLILFDENNFDLNPTQSNYVTFEIHPNINLTSQTNNTYEISIGLSSENAGGTEEYINVFVPYHIFDDNMSTEEWWEEKLEFCNAYPTSYFCISEPIIKYLNQTTNATPIYSMNFSEPQLTNLLRTITTTADTSGRIENQWKTDVDSLKKIVNSIQNTSKEAYEIALDNEKRRNNTNTILILFFTFLTIIGCILTIFYTLHKKRQKMQMHSMTGLKFEQEDD